MKRIESVTPSIRENILPNCEDDYIKWVEKVRAGETHVFSYPDIGKKGHSMVLIDINRNYGKGEGRLLIPQAVDALYHHINTYSPDWYCDRAFLPDDNLVKLMCTEGVSLISQGILSAKEAKKGTDFEIVGISITHPLQFFQMLKALELSGLTPTRNNRSDKEPLVILGGEGLVNPLPFTPFADITVVGDGEEALLKTLAELSDKNSKEAKLQKLTQARIPGVYVSAYPPEIGSFRSAHIKYNQQRYPPGSVVVKDGVSSLVINKGCRYHCGFCQYTHTHGLQQRRFRDLTEHMQLLKNAGAKTLVLISAAASNYFYKDENGVKQTISDIVKAAKELELEPVLSADRPEDAELILQATTPNKVVFAPEASPELRQVVLGKTIAENDLLRAIESSIQHGVPTVNLFAIVGIPGETAGDLNYFVDLSSKIIEMFHQSAVPNPLINLHIMPLLASPYTPLDTAAMVTYSEYMEKVNWVRNQIPIQFRKFINVYPNITETHFMTEVLFKRGDADIGLVFLALYRQLKNGEQVNPDDLRSFLTRQGYNFEDFLSAKTTDDLPRIMSIH